MQFFTFCLTRLNKPAKRIFTFSVWMFLFAIAATRVDAQTITLTDANSGLSSATLSYGQKDVVLFGFGVPVVDQLTITQFSIQSSVDASNYFSNGKLYRSADAVFSSDDELISNSVTWGSTVNISGLSENLTAKTYYFLVGDYTELGAAGTIRFSFSTQNTAVQGTIPTTIFIWTVDWPVSYSATNNISGKTFTIPTPPKIVTWIGTTSNWNTGSNWSGNGGNKPGLTDIAYIGTQSFSQQPAISQNTSVGAIVLGTSKAVTLTVNSGSTLTVNGDITQQSSGSSTESSTLTGNGSITVNSINVGSSVSTSGYSSATYKTTLISSIANVTVNNNINLQTASTAVWFGTILNNISFEPPSGKLSIKGAIETTNASSSNTSTFTLNTGAKTGSINLASATPFSLSSTGTNTVDFSGTSGYVNYNGSVAQTIVQGTGITYGNKIKVNNPAGVSLNAALSIPTLTIGDETANSVFDEKGFLTGLTSLTIKNASKFADGNSSFSFPATTVLDAGTTLEFNKAGAQTITLGSTTPQNVILSGSGTKTITAASSNTAFKIGGDLTITSPATIAYSSKINAIKIGGDFNEGSALNSGTLPVNIGGDWNNTATSTVVGTVTYDGSVNQKVGGVNYTDLILNNGGIKTVNSAATVSGNVSVGDNTTLNSNGNLTLKATATTNANIAPLLNGAKVTGNVTIEAFLTGGESSYRGTRILSSPINDNLLSSGKTYEQLKNYVIITGPGGTANGFDAGGKAQPYAITLTKYNESATLKESQFTPVAAISETSAPGTGFFLFYRGDRSNPENKVNAPYPVPENTTVKYTGPINQGDVTVNLSYHNYEDSDEQVYNGYNLVGNPYPSVIDWSDVTKVNAQDALMIIKPGGGYATYTKGITVPSTIDLHYIQPGQGFYVRATAANASITFTESCKITSKTPPKMMSTPNQKLLAGRLMSTNADHLNSAPQWNLIRLQLKDATNTEEAVVVFNQSSNANADNEDITFFGGSTISLSTESADDKNLTINFMPDITAVSEVKLNVSASKTGSITLNATDLSGAGPYQATLEDTYLNKEIDLTANPSYTFEVNRSIPATFGSNRFKIRFTAPKVSPINLASFTAEQNQSGAELQWITKNEVNTDYFEVERSVNGETPVVINKINAAGNSIANIDYSLIDQNPANGVNYYRIKQVDKNGNVTYSDVIALNYQAQTVSSNKLIIYPNPVEAICNVKLAEADNVPLLFNIYDLQGKKVKSEAIAAGSMLKFNVSDLNKNIYILEAINSRTKQIIGKTKLLKE